MKIRFDNDSVIEEFLKTTLLFDKPPHVDAIVEYHLQVKHEWYSDLLIIGFSKARDIFHSRLLLSLKEEELLLEFIEKHYPEALL